MKASHFLLPLLFAAFVSAGCGSGSTDSSALGTAPNDQASVGSPYAGQVYLGRVVPNATVTLNGLDGSELFRLQGSASGAFVLPAGLALPKDFRVSAALPGTSLRLLREVRSGSSHYLRLTVPTTLASLYLQSHPGESLENSETYVRTRLGLAPDTDLGAGVDEGARSDFSHLAFFVDASQAGGFQALLSQLQTLPTRLDATPPNGRFRLRASDLTASLDGLEPALANLVRPLQRDRRLRLGVLSATGHLLGYVGDGIASSVLDASIDTAWTKFAEETGLNFGTTVALDQIQQQLKEVLDALVTVENQLTDSDYNTDVQALLPSISFLKSLSTDGNGLSNGDLVDPFGVQQALLSYYQAHPEVDHAAGQNLPNLPAPVPTGVGKLLSSMVSLDTSVALNSIIDDQQEMNDLWRQIKVDQALVTSVSPKQMNFPVRSNFWLDSALGNYNYYAPYEEIGANWFAENARQGNGNPGHPNDLAGNLNAVIPTVQSVAAAVRKQRGQFPVPLPSDDVLVDLNAGLMWYLPVQGPARWQDADAYASTLEVKGPTVSGKQASIIGWRLPTQLELSFLADRARFCTPNLPDGTALAPVNSDNGSGDYGAVTRGLQYLGFSNVVEAFTSPDNGGNPKDGGMWMKPCGKDAATGDPVFLTDEELEINHESKDPNLKNNQDKRPFLVCRQIDKTLINPGIQSFGEHFDFPDSSRYPAPLQPQPLDPALFPALGVPTAIRSIGNISPERAGAQVTYTITSGGGVTIGKGSSPANHSLPEDNLSQTLATYNGTTILALNELVWYASNLPALVVSNYPPKPNDGGTESESDLLNAFGTAATLLWQTSDGQTSQQPTISVSTTGYSGTFPAVLTDSKTISSNPVYSNGLARQPKLLQVSPRNRVYDSQNLPSGERYEASLFYDNKTLESESRRAVWELRDVKHKLTGQPFDPSGAISLNVLGDPGVLSLTLSKIPTSGITFSIRATHLVNGQPYSDTVQAEVLGTQ